MDEITAYRNHMTVIREERKVQ